MVKNETRTRGCISWESQRLQGGQQGDIRHLSFIHNYLLKTLNKWGGISWILGKNKNYWSFSWIWSYNFLLFKGGCEGQMLLRGRLGWSNAPFGEAVRINHHIHLMHPRFSSFHSIVHHHFMSLKSNLEVKKSNKVGLHLSLASYHWLSLIKWSW